MAFAAVVLAVAGYWFFAEGPGWPVISPRGSTVAQFTDDGDGMTSSFRVREGWRIQWESSAQQFAFTIRGDRNLGTVVDVSEPGSGITTPPSSGTFSIEVRSDGPWSLTILQGR